MVRGNGVNKKLYIQLVAATVLLTSAFAPVFAATSGFIDVFVDEAAQNCNYSVLVVESTWSYTRDDFEGEDVVGIMVFDGSGNALAADWQGTIHGQKFLRLTAFGGDYSNMEIHSRPITIDLYDLSVKPVDGQNTVAVSDSILSQSAPLLERLVYDPADYIESCNSIPLAANLRAEDELLRNRRLALGIPMTLLLVLVPIVQAKRKQGKEAHN